MDAGNMLKPALARGELHCVGATTLDEYRKYVEKDAALERRFQKVLVDEPSVEDTIAILRGLKERYEVHHQVEITDPAIVAAATLSHRYISDRQLPDKAIDLIDEAASRIRMEIDSKPEEMDRLERRLIQLKIEREALKKEADEASKRRLADLEREIEQARSRVRGPRGGLEGREGSRAGRGANQGGARARARRAREGAARVGPGPHGRAAVRQDPRARAPPRAGAARAEREGSQQAAAQQGHGGRSRRGRLEVDRHSRREDARGREGQAAADGAAPRSARRRPERSRADGVERDSPRSRGAVGSESAERLVPVPGPHGRRQDRAHESARVVPVRYRGGAWSASTCRSSWRSTPSRG